MQISTGEKVPLRTQNAYFKFNNYLKIHKYDVACPHLDLFKHTIFMQI